MRNLMNSLGGLQSVQSSHNGEAWSSFGVASEGYSHANCLVTSEVVCSNSYEDSVKVICRSFLRKVGSEGLPSELTGSPGVKGSLEKASAAYIVASVGCMMGADSQLW